ncbi:MAG: hypothetical protein U0234_13245 [Sandaracinus sp.]
MSRSNVSAPRWVACAVLAIVGSSGCCFGGAPGAVAPSGPAPVPTLAPLASPSPPPFLPRSPWPAPSPTYVPVPQQVPPALAPPSAPVVTGPACAPIARRSSMPPGSTTDVLAIVRERASEISALCAGSEHSVGESAITSAIDACVRTVGPTDLGVTICEAGDCCGLVLRAATGTSGADDDGTWLVIEGPTDVSHPRSIVSGFTDGHVASFTSEPFDPIANPNCTREGVAIPPAEGDWSIPDGFTPVYWMELGPGVRALVCQQPG